MKQCVGGWMGLCLGLGMTAACSANVVITEVMSGAAETWGTNAVPSGPDFIELTNVGTNRIDLSGYSFSDADMFPVEFEALSGLVLDPGESTILVRYRDGGPVTSKQDFLDWWWAPVDQPENLQVRFYSTDPESPGIGLNCAAGDGLVLWDAFGQVVDWVDFGPCHKGFTFVPDSTTGSFGVLSRAGDDGVFKAARADDVGSPGTAPDRIELYCITELVGQSACPGSMTTLNVLAGGLPRPVYHWFLGGEPIEGFHEPFLALADISGSDAGSYSVLASNCFGTISCGTAELVVGTEAYAPILVSSPESIEVFPGQTARFSVAIDACPPPIYIWLTNGVPIQGATDSVLEISNATLEQPNTVYTVIVRHPLGNLTNAATLSVIARPYLRITEIMPWPHDFPGEEHNDWFELTNRGDTPVNLLGYRLWDSPNMDAAMTITNDITLFPGESMILVKGMSPAAFRRWWGVGLVKVVSFQGFGLSQGGDTIHLWNPGATEVEDTTVVAAFSFLFSWERGISWQCTLGCGEEFELCLCLSVEGEGGAFRAPQGGDIGSPGFAENRHSARFVDIILEGDMLLLSCVVRVGASYHLQHRSEWFSGFGPGWGLAQEFVATNAFITLRVPLRTNEPQGYFRLLERGSEP